MKLFHVCIFYQLDIYSCIIVKVLKQQCCYNYIVKTKPIIKQFIGNFKMLYYNTLIQ